MLCWPFSVYYILKLGQPENRIVSNISNTEKVSVATQLGHLEMERISVFALFPQRSISYSPAIMGLCDAVSVPLLLPFFYVQLTFRF